MLALSVISLIATPAAQASAPGINGFPEAATLIEPRAEYGGDVSLSVRREVPGADHCPHARKGLRFYTKRASEWRERMGAGTSSAEGRIEANAACPRIRRLAEVWRWKSYVARYHAERFLERMHDPAKAICHVFGAYCSEAIRVARCESGDQEGELSPHVIWARNGQYENLFQMGYSERRIYGWHTAGSPVLVAVRAAYRYFVASGRDWSPWTCKP